MAKITLKVRGEPAVRLTWSGSWTDGRWSSRELSSRFAAVREAAEEYLAQGESVMTECGIQDDPKRWDVFIGKLIAFTRFQAAGDPTVFEIAVDREPGGKPEVAKLNPEVVY